MYFSFDIFDTLITRKVATPKGVFLLMQKHLQLKNPSLPEELKNNFSKYRIEAEQIARLNPQYEEITLNQIYQIISRKFSLSQETSQFLYSLEIRFEKEQIVAIPSNIHKVKQLDSQKTLYISDMYLPKEVVLELLYSVGLEISPNMLFLSSELNLTKHTGDLFQYVLKYFNIQANELTHFGDNKHSDYLIPKNMGIKAELYADIQHNNFETKLLQNSNSLTEQIIVGTLRYLRLHNDNTSFNSALVFGAIPFCFYVLWIISLSKELNISRLFFISRDGQTLKQLADLVINDLNLEIETHYFYSSRYASYLGNLSFPLTLDSLKIFFPSTDNETIDTIIEKLGLHPYQNTIHTLFPQLSNKKLYSKDTTQIITDILNNDELKTYLETTFRNQQLLAKEYYQQIGLYSQETRSAIVDIGWLGTTFNSIKSTLTNSENLYAFYFGIYTKNHSFYENNIYSFYNSFFDHKLVNANLLEYLLSADHGSVIGYEKNEALVEPIFKTCANTTIDMETLSSFRKAYNDFTKEILVHFQQQTLNINDIYTIQNSVFSYASKPEKKFVSTFKSKKFASNVNDTIHIPFINKLTPTDIIMWHLLRKSPKVAWIEGSHVISGWYIKYLEVIISKVIPILKSVVKSILRWKY